MAERFSTFDGACLQGLGLSNIENAFAARVVEIGRPQTVLGRLYYLQMFRSLKLYSYHVKFVLACEETVKPNRSPKRLEVN